MRGANRVISHYGKSSVEELLDTLAQGRIPGNFTGYTSPRYRDSKR